MQQTTPWTIGRLLDWTREFLAGKGVDAPRLAAELLLSNALACKKIELYTRFAEVPAGAALDAFRAAVREAAEGRPIAHLLGRKEFYSIEFEVRAATLIPRPETEMLVDQALAYCRDRRGETGTGLDLGTGSGCVGLALCRHLPAWQWLGSDICGDAVAVASINAERLECGARFRAVQADAFDLPQECIPDGGFDVMVSNPPYIAEDDPRVDDTVRRFEPRQALFAGHDGLAFYRRMADGVHTVLASHGALFVEIGCDQRDAVTACFEGGGRYRCAGAWRDHIEGHWRVLQFEQRTSSDS